LKVPGFVGGSSPARSSFVDAQRSVNVFPVAGSGKRPALLGTPGNRIFITGLDGPIRAAYSQDGRAFVIGGAVLYEILSTGVAINRGVVPAGVTLGSISSNGLGGHQLFIVVGGRGYVYDLNTNTLLQIVSAAFPASATSGVFADGYSTVLVADSNQVQVSSLFDSATWAGLDVAARQSASDRITAIVADHLELWLFGTKAIEVWYFAGTANFPYQRVQGGYLEQGAIGTSVAKFDNTLVWVSQNDRGGGIAYRAANGYNALRISTDEVDATWATYGDIGNAESWVYEEEGHAFWIVNFPTAKRTWVYDAATQLWCERDWFNVATGLFEHIRGRCHTFVFGKHLVGDRETGTIYEQSLTALDDAGTAIRRRRRFPYLEADGKQVYCQELGLDCQTGDGLADPAVEPQITLRFSDDRAKTWSNDLRCGLGFLGDTDTIVDWNGLGSFRQRVFELECSDAVPVAWYSVTLAVTVGNN
jgi:hypothetical protein